MGGEEERRGLGFGLGFGGRRRGWRQWRTSVGVNGLKWAAIDRRKDKHELGLILGLELGLVEV